MKLGFDEAGTGQVLLLIHGFPLDRTTWADQLKGLSDIRRVVAVDLRGRGRSENVESTGGQPTMDDYAEDIAETIDSLGVDKADVAGLSMGGYVAFALLRKHPDKVRSLILVDTKAEADSPEAKEGRDKAAATARESGTVGLREGLAPKLVSSTPTSEVTERLGKFFESVPGAATVNDALAMRDRDDSTADLDSIGVPTLIIHGAEDQLMPAEQAEKMAAAIPGAKFVGVPGAGHLSPIENPEAVNLAIREFLQGV